MFTPSINAPHIDPRHLRGIMVMAAVILLFALFPDLAHAADQGEGDENLPFLSVMTKLSKALSGPFAFAISIIGIVIAGAVLIFGGDLNGFVRSLVFLILVIAVITGSSSLITFISGESATISSAAAWQPAGNVGSLA